MRAIVAVDNEWGIGKNNNLLFHIPEDMKFFKNTTTGKIVVMGKNTFKSLPNGPLKDRYNIVITKTPSYNLYPNCVFYNINTFKKYLKEIEHEECVYIIGGGLLYREFLQSCDIVYVTIYDKKCDADVFIPNLNDIGFSCVETLSFGEYENHKYKITKWQNNSI